MLLRFDEAAEFEGELPWKAPSFYHSCYSSLWFSSFHGYYTAFTLGQELHHRHNDFFITSGFSSLEQPLSDLFAPKIRTFEWIGPEEWPQSHILLTLAPNHTALSNPNYANGKNYLSMPKVRF